MPSRFDYLVRKLDELDDAIRRERREYDKARDRYEKMRTRDILEDLIEQRVLPLLCEVTHQCSHKLTSHFFQDSRAIEPSTTRFSRRILLEYHVSLL